MGLFTNPLGYAGYPPRVTGTPETQPAAIQAATLAEVEAGIIDYKYVSPATASGLDTAIFASPPALGSTTPNAVYATTFSATTPVPVSSGGSGAATFTAHGVLVGEGAAAYHATAAGAVGSVLSGNGSADPTFNLVATTNVLTNATATIQLANNTTYICSDASAVTATLPTIANSVVGSWIRVVSTGAGGVTIAQATGQEIHQGTSHTTSGSSGTLTLVTYDAVELLCIAVVPATSATWVATSANDTLTYA